MRFDTPLSLTVDRRLELAFREGHAAWTEAVRERGTNATANWLIRRSVGVDIDRDSALDAIEGIVLSRTPEDLVDAQRELVSLIREGDLEMSELLWTAIRDAALAANDPEQIEEATTELARISGELDEPSNRARVWIDYLNWRRQPGSSSDPDQVLQAFDEIIQAAEESGAHRDAARFSYLQVQFQALADAEDDRAESGDWMPGEPLFRIWS
jgi:hypothetical protein